MEFSFLEKNIKVENIKDGEYEIIVDDVVLMGQYIANPSSDDELIKMVKRSLRSIFQPLDPSPAEGTPEYQYMLDTMYRAQRQNSYPPIEEQLDMIYWDQVNDTTNFKDMVDQVKAQYPKPESITSLTTASNEQKQAMVDRYNAKYDNDQITIDDL